MQNIYSFCQIPNFFEYFYKSAKSLMHALWVINENDFFLYDLLNYSYDQKRAKCKGVLN